MMTRAGPAHIYKAAKDKAGIDKPGGIHTLRHCYATGLLEAGGRATRHSAPARAQLHPLDHALSASGLRQDFSHAVPSGLVGVSPRAGQS